MALRSAQDLGISNPRRYAELRTETNSAAQDQAAADTSADPVATTQAEKPKRRPTRSAKPSGGADKSAAVSVGEAVRSAFAERLQRRPGIEVAGQPPAQVQIAVPPELSHRLEDVTFELAGSHPRLAKSQIVIGALLWRYVAGQANDPRELLELLDRYEHSPWYDLPTERRIAGRIPANLKRSAHEAAMRLGRLRADASVRLVLSALVYEHVHGRDDPERHAALIELLEQYQAAVRPPSTV